MTGDTPMGGTVRFPPPETVRFHRNPLIISAEISSDFFGEPSDSFRKSAPQWHRWVLCRGVLSGAVKINRRLERFPVASSQTRYQSCPTMPSTRPPRLVRPGVLTRLNPSTITLLLEPFAPYLAARGTPPEVLATGADGLAGVMHTAASLCEAAPPGLIERLELLDLLCDPVCGVNFEDTYPDLAARHAQEGDSPEDIAARIIVHETAVAWREFDRRALGAKRSFHSYLTRAGCRFLPADRERLDRLEQMLGNGFDSAFRSPACRVSSSTHDGVTSLVIRHGDLLRRMNVIGEDGCTTPRILRPERVDVARFCHATRSWLVTGAGRRLQDLYRSTIGTVFHGSPTALFSSRSYTLEPLRRGYPALRCGPDDRICAAQLAHLRMLLPSGGRAEFTSPDVFADVAKVSPTLIATADLIEARIDLKLSSRRRRIPVILNPTASRVSGLQHDESVAEWLESRGFITQNSETFLLESA